MGFPHPLQLPQLRLRDKFFSQVQFFVFGCHEIFQRCHELFVSCVAQSLRKLHGVAEGFSLYHSSQQMEKLFAVQRSFSGYRFLLNMFERDPWQKDCVSTWPRSPLVGDFLRTSHYLRSGGAFLRAENYSSESASSEFVRIMM